MIAGYPDASRVVPDRAAPTASVRAPVLGPAAVLVSGLRTSWLLPCSGRVDHPRHSPLHTALQHKALMKPERLEAFPCFGPGPCKRTVPFCEGFQISAGRDGAPRTSWLTRLARRQPAPRAVGLAPASRNSNPAQAPATEGTAKKSQTCASAFPPTRTAGPKLRAGFTESPVTLMNGKWRANSVSPIMRPATWRFTVGFVAARMT